jgi:hypothetical protein
MLLEQAQLQLEEQDQLHQQQLRSLQQHQPGLWLEWQQQYLEECQQQLLAQQIQEECQQQLLAQQNVSQEADFVNLLAAHHRRRRQDRLRETPAARDARLRGYRQNRLRETPAARDARLHGYRARYEQRRRQQEEQRRLDLEQTDPLVLVKALVARLFHQEQFDPASFVAIRVPS